MKPSPPVSTRTMSELFTNKNKSGLTRDLIEALFPMFEEASAGAIAVDRETNITWINSSYSQLLGLVDPSHAIGKPVRKVIPQTRMPEVVETGKPLLLDIMEHNKQQLVVTRLPYYDDQGGIVGAVAFVLYDDLQPLTPLVSKYRRLHRDLAAARKALAKKSRGTRYSLGDFVGGSPAALEVKRRARLAAGRDMPVLLLGETGTGKEVLAQAIHAVSPRADKPFVGVNVAAVPENLLEAEFFGVAPGAYTGADRRTREGKFQLANGGTLFLDEVGDMPLPLQAKLLRALQEGEIEALGSNTVTTVDVRVIAATSRNLEAMIAEGSFRSDLYYRLNVMQIRIPPLRERHSDILGLARRFLKRQGEKMGKPNLNLSPEAMRALERHRWPGNVRELENAIERATILSDGDVISPALLDLDSEGGDEYIPETLVAGNHEQTRTREADSANDLSLEDYFQHFVLENQDRMSETELAQKLGISRKSLWERRQRLGIPRKKPSGN